MSSTIERLGRDHEEVLAFLATVERRLGNGPVRLDEVAAYLDTEVRQHFALEEQALFPVLARRLGTQTGPLVVMLAEHAAFGDHLADLSAALEAADDAAARLAVRRVIELLRAHIAKEDHVLFPLAQRMLSAGEQGEVETRAREEGAAP